MKTAFNYIPKEGFLITKDKAPVAHVFKPNMKKIKKEVADIAKETVATTRKIRIDTFNEKEVDSLVTRLGRCSRCGTQGKVVNKQFLNINKTYEGKWLCVAKCYGGKTVKPLEKIATKETTFGGAKSDFGASNE